MKKDGTLEYMKSSRLRIVEDDNKEAGTKEGKLKRKADDDVNPCSTTSNTKDKSDEPTARVVYELRATEGTRGIPKSGRSWKRVKTQR